MLREGASLNWQLVIGVKMVSAAGTQVDVWDYA